jgi:hypothetical protein
MAINVQGASAYFRTTTFDAKWMEYSTEQRSAAIAQAKRELAKAIGRPMREDEPPYREGDAKRDEFAVYEQAFYTLVRDAEPMGSGAAIPSLDADDRKPVGYTLKDGFGNWSKRALSWLADKLTVTVSLA